MGQQSQPSSLEELNRLWEEAEDRTRLAWQRAFEGGGQEAEKQAHNEHQSLLQRILDNANVWRSSTGHSPLLKLPREQRAEAKAGGALTFVYDGDGNRVAKTVAGLTTKYLVDDLNPTGYAQVTEEVAGSSVQRTYAYGNTLVSQNQLGSGQTSFYGADAHGSAAVDQQRGHS